jgi:histidyl-tRNA synthetase
MQAMGLSLESTSRPPEAIVERLIRKLRRADPQPRIEAALDSLRRLGEARGDPDTALGIARELLQGLSLPLDQLDELRAIIDLVAEQGLVPPRLVVDLGMSRGLHYYSGMIFEVEAGPTGGAGLQLCGGGRYDELIGALQAVGPRRASVPAVGFAYGLERVASVVPALDGRHKPAVMLAAADGSYARAMRGADELRARGYRVLLDVRGRSLQANLRDAERRGCRALVVVAEGRPEDQVAWHDLHDGHTAVRHGSIAELIGATGEGTRAP